MAQSQGAPAASARPAGRGLGLSGASPEQGLCSPRERAAKCAGPCGAQGPAPRLPASSQEEPGVPGPGEWARPRWPQKAVGALGQTPRGPWPPPAGPGDSLGLSCFSSRPAGVGVWPPSVCPLCTRRKLLLKAGAVSAGTHVIPHQGLCLVCLADVLPEQMGRGNASLGHFCLPCTLAHPSFSHLPSPGGQVCPAAAGVPAEASPRAPSNTKVYITGYPCEETGSRLDKVKLHFYKVPVSS